MRMNSMLRYLFGAPALLAGFSGAAGAQGSNRDLTTISLESLMDTQVTSVSRQSEELRRTAAAIFVISQEDIRQSGVTDVAELLRMVPGVDVAQITRNTWAVSVRGFNAQYATKLLVMIDGRAVYDPGFSGVFWHLQNLALEDIDRIEVIRGPGATMWGANAVNGVISITTKTAADTQGGLLTAAGGTDRPGEGSFRYGSAIGPNAFYRIFGRQTTRTSSETRAGKDGGDSWNMTDAGFRVDWDASKKDFLSIETGAYRGVIGSRQDVLKSLSPLAYETAGLEGNHGGHVLARWDRSMNESSGLTLRFYYDHRDHHGWAAKELHVFDFDLQHHFGIGSRHNVIWGAGYRENRDDFANSLAFGMTPDRLKTNLASAFLQDEAAIVPQKLFVTAGTKFERSSFTGFNVQPSLRMSWLPNARQSAWLSASRAVRTANRVERGMYLNVDSFPMGNSFGLVELYGTPSARSEGLSAYEGGYRYQANRRLWLMSTAFYNVYDHLSTVEAGRPFFTAPPLPPHLVQPLYFGNEMRGETYGVEGAGSFKLNSFLAFKGSYSFLRAALRAPRTRTSEATEGQSPKRQFYAGSVWTLPKSFEIAAHAYVVGPLKNFGTPGYTRLDLNVGWKGGENVELSVAGQNLLGPHMEFGDLTGPVNIVKRSIYAKITWRF